MRHGMCLLSACLSLPLLFVCAAVLSLEPGAARGDWSVLRAEVCTNALKDYLWRNGETSSRQRTQSFLGPRGSLCACRRERRWCGGQSRGNAADGPQSRQGEKRVRT